MSVQERMYYALVCILCAEVSWIECISLKTLDKCEVNNGGCDNNATCSHNNSNSDLLICTCNPGYMNVDTGTNVLCVGMFLL